MKFKILFILSFMLFIFSDCSKSDTIKIGFIGNLSGRLSDVGVDARNGAVLAVEEINEKGGIKGKKIELIIKDDQNNGETAKKEIQDLIEQKVIAIVGHIVSGMSLATLPIINEKKVLMISPTSVSNVFTKKDDYFFRVSPATKTAISIFAEYAFKKMNLKSVTFVYDLSNKGYSEDWYNNFKSKYTELGGKVHLTVTFDSSKKPSFTQLAKDILKEKTQALAIISGALDTALIAQHVKNISPKTQLLLAGWAMTDDLLKNVRKIEIKTRGLSHQIFAGEYHSAFKGRGMAFSEVREYRYGDDVRNMDWNVTARMNVPFIKVFEEERELTVVLLIDVSGSRIFGTRTKLKKDLLAEVAAVLSFSASINNDKGGALFFSDKVEQFIPPKKGRSHLLRIIREMLEFEPSGSETNISEALRFLTNAIKKRCTAFLLSDMIDVDERQYPRFEEAMKIAVNKHDIAAIRLYDPREAELPAMGLVRFADAETKREQWIDTSDRNVRNAYAAWYRTSNENLNRVLNKYHVDHVQIATDQDYVQPLIRLFKSRA